MWFKSIFFSLRTEVLVTLTSDVNRVLARLHQVQPKGDINFITAVRVAHVSLLLTRISVEIKVSI